MRGVLVVLLCVLGCGQPSAERRGFTAVDSDPDGGGLPGLAVGVAGARSTDGALCVAVFGGPSGFPDGPDAALEKRCVPLASQPLIVDGLVPGWTYAFSVFVDDNDNEKLDTKKFFGADVPAEGYGFSNNAMGSFGPPNWDDSKFVFGEATASAVIELNYF